MPDIISSTFSQLQEAMGRGDLSSRDLVLFYFDRIARLDRGDDGVNSVLELNPDALFIADAMDRLRSEGTKLGPLHGIPVLLKDNVSTHDKMHTSAGSVALGDNFAREDAHIAARLRKAGAIILGKANMTEFANYMGENMSNGYSSRGGQVVCPHGRNADPSGSSTGSAVSVAAGLCAAAIGTETSGSIMSPAHVNGVVGIKPTMGLVSRSGIIPISHTLDTAGPMARTVEDAALLLSVIEGRDERDPATLGYVQPCDYKDALRWDSLKGKRIGLDKARVDEVGNKAAAANAEVLRVFQELGAELIELPEIEITRCMRLIFRHEFRRGINAYLNAYGNGDAKTLEDIIIYNQRHAGEALKYGQKYLLDAQYDSDGSLAAPEYIDALAERERRINELEDIFKTKKLDAVFSLAPTNIAPFTGFPSLSLPIGTDADGMPAGAYLFAKRFDEATLIGIASALERALGPMSYR